MVLLHAAATISKVFPRMVDALCSSVKCGNLVPPSHRLSIARNEAECGGGINRNSGTTPAKNRSGNHEACVPCPRRTAVAGKAFRAGEKRRKMQTVPGGKGEAGCGYNPHVVAVNLWQRTHTACLLSRTQGRNKTQLNFDFHHYGICVSQNLSAWRLPSIQPILPSAVHMYLAFHVFVSLLILVVRPAVHARARSNQRWSQRLAM